MCKNISGDKKVENTDSSKKRLRVGEARPCLRMLLCRWRCFRYLRRRRLRRGVQRLLASASMRVARALGISAGPPIGPNDRRTLPLPAHRSAHPPNLPYDGVPFAQPPTSFITYLASTISTARALIIITLHRCAPPLLHMLPSLTRTRRTDITHKIPNQIHFRSN